MVEERAVKPKPKGKFDPRKCRECQKLTVTRPWKLCYKCYANEEIHRKYATASGRPTDDDDEEEGIYIPLPDEPCDAEPGSEEKIQVMMKRVEAKRALHHPDDCSSRQTLGNNDDPRIGRYQDKQINLFNRWYGKLGRTPGTSKRPT